jgi:hypothetical protein
MIIDSYLAPPRMVFDLVPLRRPQKVMPKRKKQADPWTISVPEVGEKYFGLSRNGSYDAAARGEIPTIKIGRLLRVPVKALEAQLGALKLHTRAA